MKPEIVQSLQQGAHILNKTAERCADDIVAAVRLLVEALHAGNKVVVFGNGGSAADAQHFAAELVGRFVGDRPALQAIALTVNGSSLTAIGNDYGFDKLFARQVEGLVKAGDAVVGISTSGNSANVLAGLERARGQGAKTIGLTGRDGGQMPHWCDACVTVPSESTARIQEAHIAIIHAWCAAIEQELFPPEG